MAYQEEDLGNRRRMYRPTVSHLASLSVAICIIESSVLLLQLNSDSAQHHVNTTLFRSAVEHVLAVSAWIFWLHPRIPPKSNSACGLIFQ